MGKETVLALLLREKGRFVSGEAVSAELGITRAAIWKSISALRAQGYEIDAVPGRGYCLKALPDVLSNRISALEARLSRMEAAMQGEYPPDKPRFAAPETGGVPPQDPHTEE